MLKTARDDDKIFCSFSKVTTLRAIAQMLLD